MEKIKKNELKLVSKEDLDKKLLELKKELFSLRGKASSGAPAESPGLIRSVKRNIARVYTYMKQKEENK